MSTVEQVYQGFAYTEPGHIDAAIYEFKASELKQSTDIRLQRITIGQAEKQHQRSGINYTVHSGVVMVLNRLNFKVWKW